MKTVLVWLAGGMLLAGVVLGFLPVNSGEYHCGSAFNASGDVQRKELGSTLSGGLDYGPQDCAGARSGARALPVALLLIGAALGIGALSSDRERPILPAAAESDPA